MVTICGNPVLSTPDGRRLDEALDSLDFMLSIDIYINETTRHADVILPPASSLSHEHYDLIFNALAVRNVARLNPAIWPRAEDERYDWEIFRELCVRLAARLGRDSKPLPPPAAALEGMLARGAAQHGVTMSALAGAEHGLDLGPLRPSLYDRLETADGKVQCAPAAVIADIRRFEESIRSDAAGSFRLIGRRHLRSNNSWMHNSQRLIKGKPRDQLMMHPDDLAALGLTDGALVEVRARTGSVRVAVQSTESVMRGVVSLPHGFGHHRSGARLGIAEQNAGVSYNDLSDAAEVDAVSGNAALNGFPDPLPRLSFPRHARLSQRRPTSCRRRARCSRFSPSSSSPHRLPCRRRQGTARMTPSGVTPSRRMARSRTPARASSTRPRRSCP
jgi:anaerobic selenocysteine-containing dehydrogenase